jgi:hypothetical protein
MIDKDGADVALKKISELKKKDYPNQCQNRKKKKKNFYV